MPQFLRRLVLVLVLLAAAAGLAWTFWPRPIEVDIARVDVGSLRVTVDEDGQTRIKERYVLSAPLAGRLQRVALDPGDAVVAAETVVAVIDPSQPALLDVRDRAEAMARVNAAQAALQRAEPTLLRARQMLEFEHREASRYREIMERDVARPRELDKQILAEQIAEQNLRSAEFDRDISRFELEQAQAALLAVSPDSDDAPLPHFEMRSPITGQVLRVLQESAAVVTPGTPLLELGDPSDLEVVVDVLSTDGAKIQPGTRVILDGWGGENELQGVVRLVEPSAFTKVSALGVDEQRVNVIIDLLGKAEDRPTLGDGFRVEAHVVLWEQPNVLKVPMSALFRVGEWWAVYVLADDRATRRQVQIGRENGLEAQVVDGLDAGEQVIIHPTDAIAEGVRVEARPRS